MEIYQLQVVFNDSNCHTIQESFSTKLIFQARPACTGLEYRFPEETNGGESEEERTVVLVNRWLKRHHHVLHQTGSLLTETEDTATLQPTNLQSSLCRSENKTESQKHTCS